MKSTNNIIAFNVLTSNDVVKQITAQLPREIKPILILNYRLPTAIISLSMPTTIIMSVSEFRMMM